MGRFAVRGLEEEARDRGVKRISVLWERGEHSPEGFYLKLGFVPTGKELFGETAAFKDLGPRGKMVPERSTSATASRLTLLRPTRRAGSRPVCESEARWIRLGLLSIESA
ncbi:hypothetical protein [Arthrobacter sp. PL16]|uniref:hypothetical protein n=1 Tax=Arthrobacter sp. PL16 TaxID=3071720 RepID=UPI003FA38737